jgi:hypothetical protein
VAIATGRNHLSLPKAAKPPTNKNPHAVALGRKGGKVGGKARAYSLTAEERPAIAVKGGQSPVGHGERAMSPGDHPLNRRVSIVQDMKALDDNPVFMWTQQKIEAAMKSVEPFLEIEASRDHDAKTKARLRERLEALRVAALPPGNLKRKHQ